MASLSQLAEDILTCTLCLEKVREPRTLPCLHTFCRYCLSAYVRQTVKDWAFPCPLCAQDTRPAVKLSVDHWLESFPASNFLQQLTRVLEARQAEQACDICRQEQVLVEAAVWCRTCMEALCGDCHRVHTRSKASRDHALVSMDTLLNDPVERLVVGPAGKALNCVDHRGKTATLMCVDCKKLACETCVALSHPTCRRIEHADKLTPVFRKDLGGAKQHVESHARAAGHVAERLEQQLDELRKSRDVAVEEAEVLKRRLLELVEQRHAKAWADVENVYSQQREALAQRVVQSRGQEKVLGRTGRFLDMLLSYGSDQELLGHFDNVLVQARVVDTQAAALKQNNENVTLKFSTDKKASETLKNLSSLGEVKVVKTSIRGRDAVNKDDNINNKNGKGENLNRQLAITSPRHSLSPRKASSFGKSPRDTPNKSVPRAKMVASFSGRANSDTMRTDLRGVVCLRSGDIIVMDVHFRNKRLKKFSPRGKLISSVDTGECPYGMALIQDTDLVVTHPRAREFETLKKFSPRGKLISSVDTGECPYGMALIQDTDLVVTHPRAREFVFVAAQGSLHVTGKIKTTKSYFSLASSSTDGILAAVGSSPPEPPSIDLIGFDGDVLSTITLDRVRFPFPPKDIALPPSGDILLLFSAKETLVHMAHDGSVKRSFTSTQTHDVKRPVSVDGDAQGNAYVADADGHKVHVITSDGKYGGELMSRKEGLREPLALFAAEEGHVVVTQSNGDVKTYAI